MTAEPYRVVEVTPAWAIKPEPMGAKRKIWYRDPTTGHRLLFKHPRPNTGEHWAEKIAAEVASEIGVCHAEVDLAVYDGVRGSVTKDFTTDNKVLRHGNELLRRAIDDYNPDRTYHQPEHTLANIFAAVDEVFRVSGRLTARTTLASYLILDALIGNTDRHHENWGVLASSSANDRPCMEVAVAPSFDHASSLGRELTDARREQLLNEDRLSNYLSKGRGAIYWSADASHGPSPMELVRRASEAWKNVFAPGLVKVAAVSPDAWQHIVGRVPPSWMTATARRFACGVLRCSQGKLRALSL